MSKSVAMGFQSLAQIPFSELNSHNKSIFSVYNKFETMLWHPIAKFFDMTLSVHERS